GSQSSPARDGGGWTSSPPPLAGEGATDAPRVRAPLSTSWVVERAPPWPSPASGGGKKLYFHRQADVVLRKRARRRLRAHHIVELGKLALAIEGVVGRVEVKELRHPPGETLRLPHPAQAGRRIALDQFAAPGAIELLER